VKEQVKKDETKAAGAAEKKAEESSDLFATT
jgi:hypothetical protein